MALKGAFAVSLVGMAGAGAGPGMASAPPEPKLRWTGPVAICVAAKIPGDEDIVEAIARAARRWGEVSGIQLHVYAGECVKEGSVKARIDRRPNAVASANMLGSRLAAGGGQVMFRVNYLFGHTYCGKLKTPGREVCIYADALHEIGHVLGFGHDHVSTNAPRYCPGRIKAGERIDPTVDYYDAGSIMNYCNQRRWFGILSSADKCSARVAYPMPGDGSPDAEACTRLAAADSALESVAEQKR